MTRLGSGEETACLGTSGLEEQPEGEFPWVSPHRSQTDVREAVDPELPVGTSGNSNHSLTLCQRTREGQPNKTENTRREPPTPANTQGALAPPPHASKGPLGAQTLPSGVPQHPLPGWGERRPSGEPEFPPSQPVTSLGPRRGQWRPRGRGTSTSTQQHQGAPQPPGWVVSRETWWRVRTFTTIHLHPSGCQETLQGAVTRHTYPSQPRRFSGGLRGGWHSHPLAATRSPSLVVNKPREPGLLPPPGNNSPPSPEGAVPEKVS